MPGISFDQAADYYDQTRGFGEGVADKIRESIINCTQAVLPTRFLELGVGTGRIALPFINAGYDYTGIDLSVPMMQQLERKLAATNPEPVRPYRYKLLQGDVTALPFPENSFEVIIAVHVLHLVDGWQKAVDEARRVLHQPGFLILAHEEQDIQNTASAVASVNKQWDNILKELGVNRKELVPGLPEWGRDTDLENYLVEIGGKVENKTLLEFTTSPLSPRQMAQRHIDRMYSRDWRLRDSLHAEAVPRLQKWLAEECPDPDLPSSVTAYFKAVIARWP